MDTKAALAGESMNSSQIADRIVRDVGELPDRTSPDDEPAMMLVTAAELREIVLAALSSEDSNVG